MFCKKPDFFFFKINSKTRTVLFFILFLGFQCWSQIEKQNQFANEYQFNKTVGGKTTTELDLIHTYTSGVYETNPFYRSSQIAGRLWLHYYASKKWKLSGGVGYLYNKDVPEISQEKLPEIRFTAQGIYYLIKKNHVLTNRFRIEDRILQDEDSGSEVVFRFREMVKLVYPISAIKFGKGSLYSIASDEICIKTKSVVTGNDLFDRNRLTLGFGYSFSDALQFELTYVNEYLPRTTDDKLYNVISTTLIFNDFISVLRKKSGNIPTY